MFCSKFAKAKENLNPTSPKPKTKSNFKLLRSFKAGEEVCVKFCEDLWLHTMGLETWLCHTHEHHHHWASTNGIPTRNQWLLKRLPTHWLQHHCHHSHQNMWNFAPLKPQQFWFPRVLAIYVSAPCICIYIANIVYLLVCTAPAVYLPIWVKNILHIEQFCLLFTGCCSIHVSSNSSWQQVFLAAYHMHTAIDCPEGGLPFWMHSTPHSCIPWISFRIVFLLEQAHMVDMVMHGWVIRKTDDYVKKANWAQPVLGLGPDWLIF